MLEALIKAIDICGSQAEFARRLDVIGQAQTPPIRCGSGHVWAWVNRDKKISEVWARHAETVVGAQVTRYELRPDVFGEPDQKAA